MKYYQAIFTINPDSKDARDILSALAGEAGFESFEDADGGLKGYVQVDNFDKEALDTSIENFPLEGVRISYDITEADDEDWNSAWEDQGFEPILIDGKCVIYDARDKGRIDADHSMPQLKIGIEARQAFGTGNHETTQMMVSTLLGMDLKGKHVLDCGCGTGILGIVAAKCGAEEVVGYDIDDWSVRNARHNAEINGVSLEVFEGDKGVLSHISGVFDIVLANINRNILLADMDAFCDVMSKEALLVVSGFYDEDVDVLVDKARSLSLALVSRKEKDHWTCLAFKPSIK